MDRRQEIHFRKQQAFAAGLCTENENARKSVASGFIRRGTFQA